jgi:hypothetical protein
MHGGETMDGNAVFAVIPHSKTIYGPGGVGMILN